MREIKKLVDVLNACSSSGNVLSQLHLLTPKERIFIQNIESGDFKTDTDASQGLYKACSNEVKYKMLKHRVKKKLIKELSNVSPEKVTSNFVRQKELECNSLIYQANIVRARYEFELVISLANKALAIAQEFDFIDLKVSALELLSLSYSEQGLVKKFEIAQIDLNETMHRFMKEREAVLLFHQINIQLRKSTKTRKEFLPLLPGLIKRLESLWQESGTFSAYYAYYRAYIWYHELEGNFMDVIHITLNTIQLVEQNRINAQRFDQTYNNFILVYAHLRAKQFDDGLQYAEKNLHLYQASTRNWFAFLENYFLLAIHAKRYALAELLLQQVFENVAFASIPTAAKERWLLYRAYFRLVYPSASNSEGEAQNPYFLSLPEYSKDKLGFNVAILTLQFIYLLERGDSEALIYRIESIKKYMSTYLKDVFSLRSKLFLKLLVLTVSLQFDAKQCLKKGKPLYNKLLETPAPGDAYAEIEIVPYEHLWELILHILTKAEANVTVRAR